MAAFPPAPPRSVGHDAAVESRILCGASWMEVAGSASDGDGVAGAIALIPTAGQFDTDSLVVGHGAHVE